MPRYRFDHDVALVFASEQNDKGETLCLEPGDEFDSEHEIHHPYLTEVKPAKVTTEKEVHRG